MIVGTKPLSGLGVSRNQADRRGRIVLDLHVIRTAQIRGDPDSLSATNHGVIRRAVGNGQVKPRGRQHAWLPRLTGCAKPIGERIDDATTNRGGHHHAAVEQHQIGTIGRVAIVFFQAAAPMLG